MATKYVIRKQSFWYTDEWYLPLIELAECEDDTLLGGIYDVFNDYEGAYTQLRHLVIRTLRQKDYCNGFDPEEFLPNLEKFIQQNTNNPLFKLEGSIPPELNDDDLFKFAQATHWMPYVIRSFTSEQKLYAVWSLFDEQYLIDRWDSTTLLLTDEHGVTIGNESSGIFYALQHNQAELMGCIVGHYDTLSEYPELLRQLLRIPDTGITFNTLGAYIEFNDYHVSAQHFHTLNRLLKEPFYELHLIRPDQIKQVFENPTVKIL